MSAFSAHKLQEAVFDLLSNDSQLNSLVTAVYDEPPSGAVMPYVSLGDTSAVAADTKTEYGMVVTYTVEVWSDEASQMQSKEIMAVIDDLLHDHDLTVADFELVYMYHEKSSVERKTEEASIFHHGKLTYQARIYRSVSFK